MGLIYMNGNLVELTHGLICYSTNCKGIMLQGIPQQIKFKFPEVYKDYRKAFKNDQLHLGNLIDTKIKTGLHIISMCSQYSYPIDGESKNLYTNYAALKRCLSGIKLIKEMTNLPVFFQYKVGCGNDGGNWDLVKIYIDKIIPDSFIIRNT